MSEIMSNEQNYKMDVISRKNINENDLFEENNENMSPCSKKKKLFDEMEKQFLSTDRINILNEIKSSPFISLHKESKKTTESTKNQILVVIENNDDKSAAREKKVNENGKEVTTTCEISQTEIRKDNLSDKSKPKESTGNRHLKIETKNKNEEKKSETVSDCKDFENILDQNMQDQDIGTSDVESEQDENEKQRIDVKSDQDEKEKQRIDVKSDQDEKEKQRIDVKRDQDEKEKQRIDAKSDQDEKEKQRIDVKRAQDENEEQRIDVKSDQDEKEKQRIDAKSDQDEKEKQRIDAKSDQDEKEKQRIDAKSDQDENEKQRIHVKSYQDGNKSKQLNFEDKEISRGKENANDNNLHREESKLDDNKKPKNGGGGEEDNKSDSDSESEDDTMRTPLSFQEQRRLNKLKLAGQMSNLLDSARLKLKNIAERLDKEKLDKEMNSNPRKRKRSVVVDQSTRELIKEITPVRRSSRQVERKYYTEGVSDPELMKLLTKLEKYMRLNGKFKPSEDESCYEQDFLGFKQDESRRALYPEDYNPKRRRYRRIAHTSRSVPVPAMDPSEITDSLLSKVATHVSAKVYSQTGSTCHQCRQKTLDTKTFCRSGVCTGVRGQFCGVCLLNRYGEDIVKTLLDEKWACPPCRNICNCSICRNRKGLPPTGILTPLALGKGFDSVKDYLKEAEKDLEFEEY